MKNIALILKPAGLAGHGTLLIGGLDPNITHFDLIVMHESKYLQAPGSTTGWGSEKCTFTVNNITSQDGNSLAQVGPALVDPIAKTALSGFQASVIIDDIEYPTRFLRVENGLLSSEAQGSSNKPNVTTSIVSQPAPVIEPEVQPEPKIEPEPEPIAVAPLAPEPIAPITEATTKKSPTKLILVLIVLLLLGALGAGAWWWFKQKAIDLPVNSTPIAQKKPELAVSACELSQMGSQSDLAFIQSCLQENPDSNQVLSIIQQAKQSNHCSIAQRLYANRSQAGDLTISQAYVKEYDPKYHQASACFSEPSIDTAKYWYETILQTDPDNTEAQTRLAELNS